MYRWDTKSGQNNEGVASKCLQRTILLCFAKLHKLFFRGPVDMTVSTKSQTVVCRADDITRKTVSSYESSALFFDLNAKLYIDCFKRMEMFIRLGAAEK